jgi:glycosyltransferase involved in cell wall biosynthesis
MRLNWFSPLPPTRTEIAHYTVRILPVLRERVEIVLWTDQAEWDPVLENYAAVQRYQPQSMPWVELNRASMSIYHIGNNSLFHGPIWQVSRQHPGLVVLHDLRLHHFFAGLYLWQWNDPSEYLTQMELHYGWVGRQDAESFLNGAHTIEYMAEHYPLTSLALGHALGVLVHTREGFDVLKQANRWPVAYASLPHAASSHAQQDWSRTAIASPDSVPYRLIVFGYLDSNRRLDVLLQALAAFPARDQFRLDIYGELRDSERVQSWISSARLEGLVAVHGFVPEAELDTALARAHLAINLRYPTMGEASASQLRIWDHALPSLVTPKGWYASLPEDVVAFVRPDHEIADIQAHLRALLANPAGFAKMGENGRRLLEEHHAPEIYAQALVGFVAAAQRFRPLAVAYRLAERLGAEIGAWLSPGASEEAVKQGAEAIYGLVKKQAEEKKGV